MDANKTKARISFCELDVRYGGTCSPGKSSKARKQARMQKRAKLVIQIFAREKKLCPLFLLVVLAADVAHIVCPSLLGLPSQ